jgi:hypothetical protein
MSDSGFALRFPFRPTHAFSDVDDGVTFQCNELTIGLQWTPPQAVLRIGPFATHDEAEAFLPRTWAALAWTSITRGIGFSAEMTWSHLAFPDDPVAAGNNVAKSFGLSGPADPLHALGDDGSPCVVPIGKNYRFLGVADARASVSEPHELFGRPLVQALSSPSTEILYSDERLRTAVQLFSEAHREVSTRARFLTHVIALEVLTEPRQKHPIAQRILDELSIRLAEAVEETRLESEEWHALDSLRRELEFRRETSLRSRVRQLMLDSLAHLPHDEQLRRARKAVWAYDQRSSLIHDGHLPPDRLHEAAEIARRALLDVLRQRVGLPVLEPSA